jgi:cellulose synthase operon protein C
MGVRGPAVESDRPTSRQAQVLRPSVWRRQAPPEPRSRRQIWVLGSISVVVVALLFSGRILMRSRAAKPTPGPVASFDELVAATSGRPLLARLSHPAADRHRAYREGSPWTGSVAPLLVALEQAGDRPGMVAAYLMTGSVQQAAAHASLLPVSADAVSDRAAVELSSGRALTALTLLDGNLSTSPGHGRSLWNMAVARQQVGLTLAAAADYEAVARLREGGWAEEAQERARRLREIHAERLTRWQEVELAVQQLKASSRVPSPALVRRNPELWREQLYGALRGAEQAGKLEVLGSLATPLDRAIDAATLSRHLAVRRGRKDVDLVDRGLAPPVLLRMNAGPPRPALVAAKDYAAATGDVWLDLQTHGALALRLMYDGDAGEATERLEALVKRCEAAGFRRLCEVQRIRLAWVLGYRHLFPAAVEQAQLVLRNARTLGEVDLERAALSRLAESAAGEMKAALVRAYFDELQALAPGSCEARTAGIELLANLAVRQGDLEAARRELKELSRCPHPLGLSGAGTLRALVAAGGTDEERALMERTLFSLRERGGLPDTQAVILTALQARISANLAEEPAELRSLARTSTRLPADDWGDTARLLTHAPLIDRAVARGEHRRALELSFAMHRATPPRDRRCWMALGLDGNSAGVVVRTPEGVSGAAIAPELMIGGGDAWLSADLRDRLGRCAEVSVLASAAFYGLPALLPSSWAWAYADADAAARRLAPTVRTRLVISDVPLSPELGLEPLAPWSPQRRPGEELIHKHGDAATPAEILRVLASADEIAFHVHGRLDLAVSRVPYLVLAPEPAGQYALTAEMVRAQSLQRRAPVVLLAACEAGKKAANVRSRFSLPRAFLDAGARAVIAAPVAIPDAQAGAFFEEISAQLAAGASPAAAVQAVRRRQDSAVAGQRGRAWFEEVVVFQR